jgi:hypothetical protein
MPAHSGEIISQIAALSVAMRHAQFFGTEHVMKRPGSAAKRILRDRRTRRAFCTRGKATHTDPQLLFSAAS